MRETQPGLAPVSLPDTSRIRHPTAKHICAVPYLIYLLVIAALILFLRNYDILTAGESPSW